MNLTSRGFRGISSHFVLRYFTIFLTTVPLRLRSFLFLEIQDGLLAEENQHLPFVGNKAEIFWKLFEVPESHAHCHDAGTDAAVVRDLVTDDGALRSIHDEPDISFNTTDLDIGFIGSESAAGMIVIVVHERFYTDSGSLTVVGDLLV